MFFRDNSNMARIHRVSPIVRQEPIIILLEKEEMSQLALYIQFTIPDNRLPVERLSNR